MSNLFFKSESEKKSVKSGLNLVSKQVFKAFLLMSMMMLSWNGWGQGYEVLSPTDVVGKRQDLEERIEISEGTISLSGNKDLWVTYEIDNCYEELSFAMKITPHYLLSQSNKEKISCKVFLFNDNIENENPGNSKEVNYEWKYIEKPDGLETSFNVDGFRYVSFQFDSEGVVNNKLEISNARFKKKEFDATIQPNNSDLGQVSITGFSANADGSFTLQDVICGTTIENITATTKSECAKFVRWSDGEINPSRSLNVTKDTTIKAIFIYTSNEIVSSNAEQVVCHGSEIEDIYISSTKQINNFSEIEDWCKNTIGGLSITEKEVTENSDLGENVEPCTDYFDIRKPSIYHNLQINVKDQSICNNGKLEVYFYNEGSTEFAIHDFTFDCPIQDFWNLGPLQSGLTYYIKADLGNGKSCLSKFEKDAGTITPATEYLYTISGNPLNVGNFDVTMIAEGNNSLSTDCSTYASMGISIRVQKLSISDLVVTNPTCYDASNGTITFTVSGGTEPYTVSNGGSAEGGKIEVSGLSKGEYKITVKDKYGCTITTEPLTVVNPKQLNIQSVNEYKQSFCEGIANVPFDAIGIEGGAGLTYQWKIDEVLIPGENGEDLNYNTSTMAAGNYVFTREVKDDCTKDWQVSDRFEVEIEAPIVIKLKEEETICAGKSITLTPEVSGKLADSPYSWSDGSLVVGTEETLNVSPCENKTYTLTVKGKQCPEKSSSVLVTVNQPKMVENWPENIELGNECYSDEHVQKLSSDEDIKKLYDVSDCGDITVTHKDDTIKNNCNWSVTRTYTIKDACGNTVTQSPTQIISGKDASAPVLTGAWPADITGQDVCYSQDLSAKLADDATIAELYSDCGEVTVTHEDVPTIGCSWSIVRTYTIKDACGNTVTPSPTQTISGSDQTAPALVGEWPADITGQNNCFANADISGLLSDEAVKALYEDCGDITVTHTDSEKETSDCGWTITRTYTISDKCQSVTNTMSVSGSDQTAPVITTLAQNADFGNNPDIIAPIFEVSDNCDNSVEVKVTTKGVEGESCNKSQTWTATATDVCGNEADPVVITYTWVEDTEAPIITDLPEEVAANVSACEFSIPNLEEIVRAKASDNCSEDLIITQTPEVGKVITTSTNATIEVKDNCGNTSVVEMLVTVPSPLQLSILSSESYCKGDADGVIEAQVEGGVAPYGLTVNGEIVDVTIGEVGEFVVTGLSDNSYELVVKDANGCMSSATTVVKELENTIEVTAKSDSKIYDGEPLTFDSEDYVVKGDLLEGDEIVVTVEPTSIKNVGSIETSIADVKILRGDLDVTCYYGVEMVHGTLIILKPSKVQVTITEHGAVKTYNNEEYVVTGYDFATSNDLYTLSDFKFHGDSVVLGTNVGNYPMDLKPEDFENINENFEVEFKIVNDSLVINPLDVLVEITGNSLKVPYDKNEHEVSGYQWSANSNLYTIEDFEFGGDSALAETNVGVYPMGLESGEFTNLDGNFKVTFNVVEDGSLTILGYDKVQVTITEHGSVETYNNEEYVVTGYDFATSNDLYTLSDFKFHGDSVVSRTNVGNYPMELKLEDFENINENFEVEFKIVNDSLVINPLDVLVEITGNSSTEVYNGNQHTLSGYTWRANSNLYTEEDFEFGGDSIATGTIAGKYAMGLLAGEFININKNFNVNFSVVEDGELIISQLDVIVTINGATQETYYTGSSQSISGYTWSSNTSTYTESDFTFSGNSLAYGINVGTYPMNLSADQFTNINKNFGKVTFVIEDGGITITPMVDEVVVRIAGHHEEVLYDGKEHTLTGYSLFTNHNLLTQDDIEFSGEEMAKAVNAGTYHLGLSVDQFKNTNKNFANVKFEVSDGTLIINKRHVLLESESKTQVYNGELFTHKVVNELKDGFAEGEGATYEFYAELLYAGEETNEFSYTLNEGTLAENYIIEEKYGMLTLTPIRKVIDIIANSAEKYHDRKPLSDPGYTYTEGVLIEGDTLIVEIEGIITEVGVTKNEIVSYRVMRGDIDVTDNYTFGTIKNGSLRVLHANHPTVVFVRDGKIIVHEAFEFVYVYDVLSRRVYLDGKAGVFIEEYGELDVPCSGAYVVIIGEESYKVVVHKK